MRALQLPFNFDPAPVLEEVNAFDPTSFYECESVYITPKSVWMTDLLDFPMGSAKQFRPSSLLLDHPHLLKVFTSFKCEKILFRVHRMEPGGTIQPHRDAGRNFGKGVIRIHIPLCTDPEFYFFFEDQRVVMQPGECWYVDVNEIHHLEHKGTVSRVHLVMDCLINDWWRTIMGDKIQNVALHSPEEETMIQAELARMKKLK